MKRNIISKSYLVLALTGLLSFSSCLKDSRYTDFTKGSPLVEFPLAANAGQFQSQSFAISNTPIPLTVAVNLASVKEMSSDLNVTVSVDQATLDAYNTSIAADSDPYPILPAADYTIPSGTVTIPAGKRIGILTVNLKTSLIDPSITYALPLKITDASGTQISNYNTIIFGIGVKNQYDGVYTVSGTMVDNASATITGNYPRTVQLITTGANTNVYFDPNNGVGNGHAILNNGGLSVYGTYDPVFTFDPATNKVTKVVNFYGQPAPAATMRSARIDASGINAVSGTPGTAGSVIKVKYVLVQAGNDRTFFDETFTYKGVR